MIENDWRANALCQQTDPEVFFPHKNSTSLVAKRICNLCPVMAECREYALGHDERYGVWGGCSANERREIRRRRRLRLL